MNATQPQSFARYHSLPEAKSSFRTMLPYMCDDAGLWFSQIDEKFSTQECGVCGARTGPEGLEGLNVCSWTC